MATYSVGNFSESAIPFYGCNKAMRMFILNSTENPKRRLWKCSNLGLRCKLFIWDNELECSTSSKHKNSIGCNCSDVVQELGCIIKDLEDWKKEKMKMKLENERKKARMLKLLLTFSWCLFFAYKKW
ncbi:unnamed protein product [Lathyrus sativus]|nr:unnamed protein product [Lathyrus sativus]